MPILGLSLFFSGFVSFLVARTNRLPGWVSVPMWFVTGSFFLTSVYAFWMVKHLNEGFFMLSVSFSVTAASWLIHEYYKDVFGHIKKVDERVIWGWISGSLVMIIIVAYVVYVEPYKLLF